MGFFSMKIKTYKIYTSGCKVNQYDSGKLAAELERAGLVAAAENADIAIINSCAVTQTAINKSRRMINKARKENPKAEIRLIGCWAKLKGEKIKKIIDQPTQAGLAMTGRSRYFIKIQDGCEQFCSYCIIPYVRGKLKSRPEAEVTAEIKQAVKAGYGEVVLSGIHLGLYGRKKPLSLRGAPATWQSLVNRVEPEIASLPSVARNDNLAGLLKKLIKIKNLGRIRLSSIEITEVTDELIKLMMKSGKICRHLHIPLQSGSDKILKLMNRPYGSKYFAARIRQIRKQVPGIGISTDVITGFPGEGEEEFKETENFIRKIKFSRLHVFPFSPHAKLPAAKLPGQVKENIRLRRARELRKLGVKLAADYKNKFRGKTLEIAVEQIKSDKIIGKTEYYFNLEVRGRKLKNLKIGQIVKVKNPLDKRG